jgi:hypothetical protein
MHAALEALLAKAFSRGPAREANQAIQRAREEMGGEVRSFEMVVADDLPVDQWLEQQLLPRFVYHLESLGIRPPGYAGIFLSLFVGEELFFVRSVDLMTFAGEQLHLSAAEMYERWGTRELRHAVDAQS